MPFVLPYLIYILGALLAYFLRGKIRVATNIVIAAVGLILMLSFRDEKIAFDFTLHGFELILYYADRTSLFMSYVFSFMALLVVLYNIRTKETVYHVCSFIYIFSAMGLIFSGDLLSFFVFGEIMLVTSTILICYNRNRQTLESAFRYFLIHSAGSSLLLAGIILNFIDTGSIAIGSLLPGIPSVLILLGIGVNAAFVPFHIWLPDVYSKAPFASSLLLSVFTTKSAVYALARMFPGMSAISYMGAFMALFGVIMALRQSDARKLLSYHVISQIGFMAAGVGMGTFLGIDGSLYHAFNNILYKTLLFMCIGAVIYRTGKQNLADLGGFAASMPITTIACIIAALSISGVPLFSGYASKAIIYEASYKSTLLLWTLKLASLGTFISFCKFTYFGFIRGKNAQVKEAPLNMTLPMIIISILCILGGIYPRLITMFLPYYTQYPVYIPTKVYDALIATTVSGILFLIGMNKILVPHAHEKLKNSMDTDFRQSKTLTLSQKLIVLFEGFRFNSYLSGRYKISNPHESNSLILLLFTILLLVIYMAVRLFNLL